MGPQAPFTIPYTEFGSNGQARPTRMNPASSCAQRDKSNCRTDNLTSADMRLRLEPTINVTEQVRVKAQLDVFDNMVMGSTPEGYYINRGARRRRRLVRRPHHRLLAQPGLAAGRHQLGLRLGPRQARLGRGAHAVRRAALRPHAVALGRRHARQQRRLPRLRLRRQRRPRHVRDQAVGPLHRLHVGLGRDRPDDAAHRRAAGTGRLLQRRHARRRLAVGPRARQAGQARGAEGEARPGQDRLQLRRLLRLSPAGLGSDTAALQPSGNTYQTLQNGIHPRSAKAFIGDIWLRLNWKKLHIEGEGAIIAGTIGNLQDIFGSGVSQRLDVDPVGRLRRQGRLQAAPRRAQDLPRGRLRLGRRLRRSQRQRQLQAAPTWCRSTTTSAASTSTPTTTST